MLDDDAIERYARQIVVPGIGAAGQQKLLASTVLVAGNERGCSQTALYLRAAGVHVLAEPEAASGVAFDLAVVADAEDVEESVRTRLIAAARPICWYVVGEDGFTAGVHPVATLPAVRTPVPPRGAKSTQPVHDAAACDAAAVACAILTGLDWHGGPFRFEL